MLEFIQFFRERDTRDELGLATIRDAFADRLFPGTTTLQTRVRYFLFVPWLYKKYENNRLSGQGLLDQLRRDEVTLINALRQSGETDGIIGQRAGKDLHRFPSSIYWIGLQDWGILRRTGTPYQYYSSLPGYYRMLDAFGRAHSDDRLPGEQPAPGWDPYLPAPPGDFPNKAHFRLNLREAEYLRDRLQHACPGSLTTYLVIQDRAGYDAPFPWAIPDLADLPPKLQRTIQHARNFSETMHGAPLLYNYMLARLRGDDDLINEYQDRMKDWLELLRVREAELRAWNRSDFWDLVMEANHIYGSSKYFVNGWLDLLFAARISLDSVPRKEMEDLVRFREQQLKGGRSRFTNKRHLEAWSGDAGTSQLVFRWSTNQRLLNDILAGLIGGNTDARPA